MTTRRSTLQLIGAGLGASLWPGPASTADKSPDGTEQIDITAAPGRVSLVGASYPDTDVWVFDGTVPGPLLRARQGDDLEIAVTNRLEEPTTVHWHGLRVPVAMDGVPYLSQPPIEPGETFTYRLPLHDAGTFWYHPHLRSSEQVGRGLYGALIVDEAEPVDVDRDVLWVLDDWRLNEEAQIAAFGNRHDASHAGRIGNSATINGKMPKTLPVRPGERVRLRLINAANARVFGLVFEGLDPWLLALDGQPITPVSLGEKPVVLGPGMRADLVIDMTGEPGSEQRVVDRHYGPNFAYELVRLAYVGEPRPAERAGMAPKPLQSNPIAEPDLAAAERHRIVFEGGAMGGMGEAMMGGRMMAIRDLAERGRLWAMNGIVPDDVYREPPLLQAGLGTSHVIELVNRTAFEHPIHLHGHVFRVMSSSLRTEPAKVLRDSVLLGVDETIEIAFVADNPGRWMFHCHILEHQESGMMGVVEVV